MTTGTVIGIFTALVVLLTLVAFKHPQHENWCEFQQSYERQLRCEFTVTPSQYLLLKQYVLEHENPFEVRSPMLAPVKHE